MNHFTIPNIELWDYVIFGMLWTVVWVLVLGTALQRKDLDARTRWVWVGVILLIPVVGALIYWLAGPKHPGEDPEESYQEQIHCMTCGTGIPEGKTVCPQCGWTYREPD